MTTVRGISCSSDVYRDCPLKRNGREWTLAQREEVRGVSSLELKTTCQDESSSTFSARLRAAFARTDFST